MAHLSAWLTHDPPTVRHSKPNHIPTSRCKEKREYCLSIMKTTDMPLQMAYNITWRAAWIALLHLASYSFHGFSNRGHRKVKLKDKLLSCIGSYCYRKENFFQLKVKRLRWNIFYFIYYKIIQVVKRFS